MASPFFFILRGRPLSSAHTCSPLLTRRREAGHFDFQDVGAPNRFIKIILSRSNPSRSRAKRPLWLSAAALAAVYAAPRASGGSSAPPPLPTHASATASSHAANCSTAAAMLQPKAGPQPTPSAATVCASEAPPEFCTEAATTVPAREKRKDAVTRAKRACAQAGAAHASRRAQRAAVAKKSRTPKTTGRGLKKHQR